MLERTSQRKASARERLLDEAEGAVLRKGFAATSIDELIAATGLSKSGFFYHFKDKNDLAKALLVRYIENDRRILDGLLERADALNDDPLHGFLVFLKFMAEMLADMPGAHPGCLAASYTYQEPHQSPHFFLVGIGAESAGFVEVPAQSGLEHRGGQGG
jgi:AcrR family transcriptional regulator